MPSNSKLIAELMNNSSTIDSDAIPNGSGVSIGTIVPYGGTSAPTGFLACDGATLDRTTYADLFSAIGTTWGAGDGATTFTIPDLRNRFIRGSSSTRSVAAAENQAMPSRRVVCRTPGGTYSTAEVGDYIHYRTNTGVRWQNNATPGDVVLGVNGKDEGGPLGGNWAYQSQTQELTANEVRPANKATLYCIKY